MCSRAAALITEIGEEPPSYEEVWCGSDRAWRSAQKDGAPLVER